MGADSPYDGRGTIVTYVDERERENRAFRRAVVTGPPVEDPGTSANWLPVVRSDCDVTLLDPSLIVSLPSTEAGKAGFGGGTTRHLLDVFARALAALADHLAQLDQTEPSALRTAREFFAAFARAITSVEQALGIVAAGDPDGGLATVLRCLSSAADELDAGNLTDARVGVLIAHATMREVMFEDNGWQSDGFDST